MVRNKIKHNSALTLINNALYKVVSLSIQGSLNYLEKAFIQ